MAKQNCDICGKPIGFLSKYKLKDGLGCYDCLKGFDKNVMTFSDYYTKEQVKKGLSGELELVPPIKIQCNPIGMLIIDRVNRLVFMEALFTKLTDVVPFESVRGYIYSEDEKSYGVGHVIGTAAVGGMLFGGAGAVVGSVIGANPKRLVKTVTVQITYEIDGVCKLFDVNLYKGKPVKVSDIEYKTALEKANTLMAQLDLLIDTTKAETAVSVNQEVNTLSAADEIRKYKALWDDGIISEEEFNLKKKELLGL